MTDSKKKLSAEEVANHFHALSDDEKKFFHMHVEKKRNEPSPENASSSGSPTESPDFKTREAEPEEKRGMFGGKKSK